MNMKKFERLWDEDMVKAIHDLMEESSKVKTEIFKSVIMMKDLDEKVIQSYMGYVNSFLRNWESYSMELKTKISQASGREGIHAMKYDLVKDYIYGKYDYASILQFTDGIIRGINDGTISTADDIEGFWDHTISKAFHREENSVGELLDNVINTCSRDNCPVADKVEAKKFDNVRNYQMFSNRDRTELYRAIDKTIQFLVHDFDKNRYNETKDIQVFVAMINNVVEYINYSLTLYAVRVYAIYRYAKFYMDSDGETVVAVTEAAKSVKDSEGTKAIPVTIMHDADEMICRDYEKEDKFMRICDNFLREIGAEGIYSLETGRTKMSYCDDDNNSNLFAKQLIGNELYNFLAGRDACNYYWSDNPSRIEEFNFRLHELLINNTQAIQGSSSPKQDILAVIASTNPTAETLDGYQTMAYELIVFGLNLLERLTRSCRNYSSMKYDELSSPRFTTGILNSMSESLKLLAEFYRDIALAILQKSRDIELKVNHLRNAEVNKVLADVSIDVPGGNKSDLSTKDIMMSAIPDTSRSSSLLDIYAKPTFEYLEMIDEYVKESYGLQNDPYFTYMTEAGLSISSLINAIISALMGIKKKFTSFFNDQQFQNAENWVKNHQADLLQMTYSGEMNVLPYEEKIHIGHINKMIEAINNFSEANVTSEDALKQYMQTVYTDEKLYNLFASDKTNEKDQKRLYTNFVIFGKDPSDTANSSISQVVIKDNQIKEKIKVWVSNVGSADATHKSIQQTAASIDQSITALKGKIVNIQGNKQTSTTQTTASSSNQQTPPMLQSDNTDNKQQQTTNTTASQNKTAEPGDAANTNLNQGAGNDLLNKALTEINVAIKNLWDGLYSPITGCIKDQYRYIQQAYGMGKKNQ